MIETIGSRCVGCGACVSACAKNCIEFRPDEEGFLYPFVDKDKCINCDACDKVCPVLYKGDVHDIMDAKSIGIRPNTDNEKKVTKSASGGAFYLIAEKLIEQGGYVFGAVFDDDHRVRHICGRTIDDVKRMQNSKYVQSDISGIYEKIKDILKKDHDAKVLFCGTPCQCAGLKSFIGKEYDNLYILDLVCHGVPSPLAFEKYLKYLEKTKGEKVSDYQFRCKHKGWNYHGYMSSFVKFNNHYWPTVKDPYMSCFFKMNDYRESCYTCRYNNSLKVSDMTLSDFAGVRELAPDFFSKAGCSQIFIHTEKGFGLFDSIKENIDFVELGVGVHEGYHTILTKERKRPKARDIVYKNINKLSDKEFVESNMLRYVSKKSILRFYMPYSLRKHK